MRIFLLILLSVFSYTVYGQELNTVNYAVNDGLPSSQVYQVVQHKSGYLWFATDRGLSRYNGYQFDSFGTKDGLTDNTVFHFYPQKDGNIWCTTFNRELFYINNQNEFIEYSFNNQIEDNIKHGVIADLLFFKNELYMTFSNVSGYVKIDKEGNYLDFTLKSKNGSVINSEKINGKWFTYAVEKNRVKDKINKTSDFFQFDMNSFRSFHTISFSDTYYLVDVANIYQYKDSLIILEENCSPLGIGKYDKNHFWIGYRYGGFKIFNRSGEEVMWGLKDKSVTNVFIDHEGGLWVSTLNKGVFYIENTSLINYLDPKRKDNFVYSLTSDPQGNLYIGYYNGDVLINNKDNITSTYYSSITTDTPSNVQYFTSAQQTVIASDNQVFYIDEQGSKQIIHEGYSLSFADDIDNGIAFGTYSGGILLQDSVATNYFNQRSQDICITEDGMFNATLHGLVWRGDSSDFKSLDHPLLQSRIKDIDFYKGNFFAASLGAGLIIFNKNKVYSIGQKEGLYSDITTEIVVENDTTIWVCTNKGLNRVVYNKNGSFRVDGISYKDGLLNNEVTDVEVIDNIVWVGTRNGLCSFDKNELVNFTNNTANHFLAVEETTVNNEIVNYSELNHLSYQENNITFIINAISFKNRLNYRYKLENRDNDWTYTNARKINFSAISSGDYIFVLQTKSFYGDWGDNEIRIPVYIGLPYYNTWWFYLVLILAAMVIIYLFFKVRILTYNRDITRELLRQILKRLKKKTTYYIFKEQGKEVRVKTTEIFYIKSSGNYLEIYTESSNYVIRAKIGEFLKTIPDPIEFLRIHRSYIVRIDKISQKNNKILIINKVEIPIGETYKDALAKIYF